MEFEYVRKVYFENIVDVTNLEENIQLIFYSMLAFFLPFFLGHPQILVGIIVNAYLILGATYLKGHKLLPVILLPSIGVLTAGVLFGAYTVFLVYMIPFIWIGNAVYAYGYKYLALKKKQKFMHKAAGIVVSSAVKSAFLFSAAFVLVKLAVIPPPFLTSMGLFQLYTALIGGAAAVAIIETRNRIAHSRA